MSFNNTLDKNVILIKPDGTYELTDHGLSVRVDTKIKKSSKIDGVHIKTEEIVGYSGIGEDNENYIVTNEVFATLRYDDRFNKRMFKLDEYDESEDTYYVYSLIGVKV